jgi:uncharacterized protein
MESPSDKLSRVAALKPRSAPNPFLQTGIADSERLIRLLGGENRNNRLGSHIFVRHWTPEPGAITLDSRALNLLAPEVTDAIISPEQWIFLDTETTGLAGGTGTYAFLIGLGWWEQNGFVVEQYFMRDHSEEPSLLFQVLQKLSERSILVTFNGKSFDWPLLQTRYRMTRAGMLPEPSTHLDLLHPARRFWRMRLKSVALAHLEQHILGLDRGQDIPSETIPQRYFDFIRGGSAEAIAEVFRHNHKDLCGLASLALHLIQMLANPESGNCCADELFGISRLLQKKGHQDAARRFYKMALDCGLPKPAQQIAQRELAFLAKRGHDFELANELWGQLLDNAAESLNAYEQLAIYYERQASLPGKAESLTREALIKLQEFFQNGEISSRKYRQWHASLQHRLTRLRDKVNQSRECKSL